MRHLKPTPITGGDLVACFLLSALFGAIDRAKQPTQRGVDKVRDMQWDRLKFAAWRDASQAKDETIGYHGPMYNERATPWGMQW